MNSPSNPIVGTRSHCVTPHSAASSAYSMSISSSVSMCSETNETGTTTIFVVPAAPSSRIFSSVYGCSHCTGPRRLWYASVCELVYPSARRRAMQKSTVASVCVWYGSPRVSTYLTGRPCAEKKTCAELGSSNSRFAEFADVARSAARAS